MNWILKFRSLKGIAFISERFNETRLGSCLLLSFAVKALMLCWQATEYKALLYPGCNFALVNGDALEYIAGAQNMELHGIYYPDAKMPGYSLLLFLFFKLFSFTHALDAMTLLQCAVGAASVVALALTAFLISRSRGVFMLILFGYLFSTYLSVFDKQILTESISIGFLIFSVYFFVRHQLLENSNYSLLWSGGFAMLAVFLRPALFVLFICYFVFLLIELIRDKKQFRRIFLKGLWLILPFLIADATWIKRNFDLHQQFIPLMSFHLYDEQARQSYYREEAAFVQAWGGDIVFWEPKAEIRWFGCGGRFPADPSIALPSFIYTSAYNADSLLKLRNEMRLYDSTHDSLVRNDITSKLKKYAASFRLEKKWLYMSMPFRYMLRLVLNGGGTFNLFSRTYSQLGPVAKLFKLFMMALFEFIAIIGSLLSLIWLFRFRHHFLNFIALFIIANLALISAGFRMCEYRYFAPCYPFCLLLIVLVLYDHYKNNSEASDKP